MSRTLGNEQLGNIVLRLLVDNKAFAEGLKNSLQLVAITSTQIRDLTTFKIGAPDFSALDLSLDLSNKKIKDLISSEQLSDKETKVSGEGLDEVAAKRRKHSETVSDGEKAVRGFRAEQRLQDYVVRQSRDSLLGMTSVLGLVTSGHGAASLATKKLEGSLVAGIGASEQMEFALFGLGQTSGKVGGSVGTLISRISSLAGPITLAVGVGAGLIALLRATNEESERAAEQGFTLFSEAIRKLSDSGKRLALGELKNELTALAERGLQLTDAISLTNKEAFEQGPSANMRAAMFEELKANQRKAEIIQDLVKKVEDEIKVEEVLAPIREKARQETLAHGSALQKLGQEIEDLTKQREKASGEDLTKLNDQIAAKEKERTKALRTSVDIAKEDIAISEQRLALGQITVDQYLSQLRHLASIQIERKDQLETEQKIRTVLEQQFALEAQRVEARKKGAESQEVAIDKLYQIEHDAALAVITNKFERERVLEDERFTKAMDDIAQADAAYPDMEDRKRAEDAATAEHRMHLVDIERQKEEATFALRKVLATSAYEAELMDIEEKYANEERQARELYAGTSHLEEVLAQLRKRKAGDIINAEMNRFQTGLSAAQTVVQNLGVIARWGLGEAGDRFLKDLETGLSVVQAIVATIEAMKTISTFLGFASGGYTGALPSSMPAGVVHGGEMVFEAPIVRNNLPALMRLRRVMQKGVSLSALVPGFAEGGFVIPPLSPEMQAIVDGYRNITFSSTRMPQSLIDQWHGSIGGGTGSSMNTNAIITELRDLKGAVRDLKLLVNISGMMSGQKFLRKEMSDFEAFKRLKQG